MEKSRVLVGMSGGVDSLASALLLREQGYTPIGVTFVNWSEEIDAVQACSRKKIPQTAAEETAEICKKENIEHHILNLCSEFENSVIQYFTDEYLSGRTPNICSHCNAFFKFEHLQKMADRLDCPYIATGHYANIYYANGRYVLSRASDDWKDQSFMLWQLSQNTLKRCIFPLASFPKTETKQYVAQQGFPKKAGEQESFNICFIPDNNYKAFLFRRAPKQMEQFANGSITNLEGEIIGSHNGFPLYTIGQTKGLEYNSDKKLYVRQIFSVENKIVMTPKTDLYVQEIEVANLNFIKYSNLQGSHKLHVRIRGKDEGMPADVVFENGKAFVHFHNAVFAPAQGQSAVFYEEKDVVCGGTIF